jgi:hypothetical protein
MNASAEHASVLALLPGMTCDVAGNAALFFGGGGGGLGRHVCGLRENGKIWCYACDGDINTTVATLTALNAGLRGAASSRTYKSLRCSLHIMRIIYYDGSNMEASSQVAISNFELIFCHLFPLPVVVCTLFTERAREKARVETAAAL